MKNILEIKKLIEKSLDILPLEIKTRYTRSHLLSALNEINNLEKLENKKIKKI
jgi:hypothetical protein